MRKTALVLLLAVPLCSCQTGAFEPIEIDLSKRTPAPAAPPTMSPTATPTVTLVPAATSAPALSNQMETLIPTPVPVSAILSPDLLTPPEQVVNASLAAYNRHDIESFLRAYASDAVLYDFPDRVRQSGREQIRRFYTNQFQSSSTSQVAVSNRMPQGNYIVEHETISGLGASELTSAIVIYEVRKGKIQRVWFLR